MKQIWISMAIVTLLAALGGCGSIGKDQRTVDELAKLPYPKDAALGPDLEIEVRQGTLFQRGSLKLTNLTPRSYHQVQLWLNQQYVTTVQSVPIGVGGQSATLPLRRFIDSHGRSYPVGGLLTPDKGFPVVLAEFYDPATRQRSRLLIIR